MSNYECPDCETALEDVSNGWYCPDCMDAWDEERLEELKLDPIERVDFPVWFSRNTGTSAKWEVMRTFEYETGLSHDDGDYTAPRSWKKSPRDIFYYKITEDLEIKGPYKQKGGEKI